MISFIFACLIAGGVLSLATIILNNGGNKK